MKLTHRFFPFLLVLALSLLLGACAPADPPDSPGREPGFGTTIEGGTGTASGSALSDPTGADFAASGNAADVTKFPGAAQSSPSPLPTPTPLPAADALWFPSDSLSLSCGETLFLSPGFSPEGCAPETVFFSTSDPSVCFVDETGCLTAVGYGTATLTASTGNGLTAELSVTVTKTSSVTISFAGDVTLGSDLINQNTVRNFYTVYDRVQDDSYFFANVLPYFASDDLTLVNLEGTLSDRGIRQDKTYAFRGLPSYVNILLAGSVEAVSLGNNHSRDYGEESYEDTVQILDEAGILHAKDSDFCLTTVNDVCIAMVSIYQLRLTINETKALIDDTFAAARQQGADLLLVSFHWGTEGSSRVNSTQQTLAHYAIDCGAAVVIGHHPHKLQAVEKYRGRYIVYSLANFCFGGNTNPPDKDTMIFRQTFTLVDGELQADDAVQIIPCSVSSVPEPNNYQPTPQTGAEAERIMERVNSYSVPFGLTFEEDSDGIYVPAATSDASDR